MGIVQTNMGDNDISYHVHVSVKYQHVKLYYNLYRLEDDCKDNSQQQ